MPEQQQRGLLQGTPGESLFHRPFMLTGPPNELPELFRRIDGMNDHRLLAIVTALLVENRLDKLLAAFLPRYKRLLEARDFVFSMKVKLLESFALIPPLILSAADCLRLFRNEFAHDLAKTTFEDVDAKVLRRARDVLDEAYRNVPVHRPPCAPAPIPQPGFIDQFRKLAFYCIVGLDGYIVTVKLLREAIEDEAFLDHLTRKVEGLNEDTARRIMTTPAPIPAPEAD